MSRRASQDISLTNVHNYNDVPAELYVQQVQWQFAYFLKGS
jgi:hypothetical protein